MELTSKRSFNFIFVHDNSFKCVYTYFIANDNCSTVPDLVVTEERILQGKKVHGASDPGQRF